jgi:hypothetical protein
MRTDDCVFIRIDVADAESLNELRYLFESKWKETKMKGLSLMLAAFLLLGAGNCFAEIQITRADIPFGFIVEGKTYPAGSYRIAVNDEGSTLTIQGLKSTKESGMALVVTRLAPRSQNNVSLVFDVVGNDHFLSEIHVPGMDGFYFKSATTKHTHATVTSPKS